MQTVKWNNKELSLLGTGKTVVIYQEEFHENIFSSMNLFITQTANGKIDLSLISKLFYALAKTANNEVFGNYKSFMENTTKVGQFAKGELLGAIALEIQEMMDVGDSEEVTDAKKKPTKAKQKQ